MKLKLMLLSKWFQLSQGSHEGCKLPVTGKIEITSSLQL